MFALIPRAEKIDAAGAQPDSSYMDIESNTTVLFIVAVVLCALVLVFCLLSVAVATCLVVYCIKLYKTSTTMEDESGKGERGEGDAQKDAGDSGVQLRALRGVTCSVESLTNGNYKQNPHYSKVEYQVYMHTLCMLEYLYVCIFQLTAATP